MGDETDRRAAEEAARRAEAAARRAEEAAREVAGAKYLEHKQADYEIRNMSTGEQGDRPGPYDDDD